MNAKKNPDSLGLKVRMAAEKFTGLGPEKTQLSIGFIPLTDCAVLAVAKEQGFFEKQGLSVKLQRETSWANIRDKVSAGVLDAAQMLAPMPIAATLGLEPLSTPMLTAITLDLNGNAITVSNRLYSEMLEVAGVNRLQHPVTAKTLKEIIDQRQRTGQAKLTFAMVSPFSTHNYELRYWLAAAGIHPDHDVQLLVIPPPYMADNLEAGTIDGYCVGEPWNEMAVHRGIGRVLITNYEIWNNSQEKVLGVTQRWADEHPVTHQRLLVAILQAAQWLDRHDNRMAAAKIIARAKYVDAPVDVVKMSMLGTFKYGHLEPSRSLPDFNVFYRYAATFPWRSYAIWFMTQMLRWGQIKTPFDIFEVANRVYRTDIYRQAALIADVPVPDADQKMEGVHNVEWDAPGKYGKIAMGSDLFFDGITFDPENPLHYLEQQKIRNQQVELSITD